VTPPHFSSCGAILDRDDLGGKSKAWSTQLANTPNNSRTPHPVPGMQLTKNQAMGLCAI
jgi:hypothetical protein